MVKAIINNKESLTIDELKEMLTQHYEAQGFKVGYSDLIDTDLYVKKDSWVGAALQVKQKKNKTIIRMYGYAPAVWARILLYSFIAIILVKPKWKELEKDLKKVLKDFDKVLSESN